MIIEIKPKYNDKFSNLLWLHIYIIGIAGINKYFNEFPFAWQGPTAPEKSAKKINDKLNKKPITLEIIINLSMILIPKKNWVYFLIVKMLIVNLRYRYIYFYQI